MKTANILIALAILLMTAASCSKNDSPKVQANDNERIEGTWYLIRGFSLDNQNMDTINNAYYKKSDGYKAIFDDKGKAYLWLSDGPGQDADSLYYRLLGNILYSSSKPLPNKIQKVDDNIIRMSKIIYLSQEKLITQDSEATLGHPDLDFEVYEK